MIHWTGDAAGSGSQAGIDDRISGNVAVEPCDETVEDDEMPERKVAVLGAGLLLAMLWSRLAASSEWLRGRAARDHPTLAGGLGEFNLATPQRIRAARRGEHAS